MTKLTIHPSADEFTALAAGANVIPVYADIVADAETPTSVYQKLDDGTFSFLLESAELRDASGRFSFLGFHPHLIVQSDSAEAGDPLAHLESVMSEFRFAARPELPRFSGGAVGFLGYDVVRFFESSVPAAERDDLRLPEMMFMIMRLIVIFDHQQRRVKIVANAFLDTPGDAQDAYAAAVSLINDEMAKLRRPTELAFIDAQHTAAPADAATNMSREAFERAVAIAKEHIAAGDIFQVVLSQRFQTEFRGDPLTLYRCLRLVNPSPYMFCLRLGSELALIGSSPEMHVRVTEQKAEVRPIAGTRRRGKTADEDAANAQELLNDEKERAEHVMLIDLARNDLGRVAEIGSVQVTERMQVERYSHVMHLVSHVVARLQENKNAFDAMRATFPAGTVSGAPKIRAMQMIAELEKTKRGCYAGAVGYFGFDGALDCCIALRSIVLKNGRAFVQAGAGIVADSIPAAEYKETCSKAAAMLEAISRAAAIRDDPDHR
jgi:anthranilate synthase component 1